MRPFNCEEAKKFMAEAGDDLNQRPGGFIRDDHAEIKQLNSAAELSQALGTIAAAVLQGGNNIDGGDRSAGVTGAVTPHGTERPRMKVFTSVSGSGLG